MVSGYRCGLQLKAGGMRWGLGGVTMAVALECGVPPAIGTEATPPVAVADYPALAWDDIAHIGTQPTRWDGQDWLYFSVDTLAVVGTAALLDRPLRNWAQRNRDSSFERGVNHFETLGMTGSFVVIGGFYLDGLVAHDPQAENTAVDSLAASIVAAGLITPALKGIAGRSRPEAHQGVYHFRPFSNGASFPSGHTTQAFAVASVIAAHYDRPWVEGVAYTAAGLVGLARLDHNAHFASDVLAGAIIGTTVGRAVVRFNDRKRIEWAGRPVTFTPWIGSRGAGLGASMDF